MNIQTQLPDAVKGFRFVKNHHFVALKDVNGHEIVLDATTILLGDCTQCKAVVVATTNAGEMTCTHCRGSVKWRYVRPQLAFIAENESKFMGWDAEKDDAPEPSDDDKTPPAGTERD